MTTDVISARVPSFVLRLLRTHAENAKASVADAVNWLLLISFGYSQILRGLTDCVGPRNAKLVVRIPTSTSDQLTLSAEQLGLSISAYTRKLLYHVYVTRRLVYVKTDDHHTLALRRDEQTGIGHGGATPASADSS